MFVVYEAPIQRHNVSFPSLSAAITGLHCTGTPTGALLQAHGLQTVGEASNTFGAEYVYSTLSKMLAKHLLRVS
ncbi:hypothetical protein HOLleu_21692 [Holothuria leucospilota]|uniref:Uncharacterized protein n=1 Tax=Holothuria leucospilota TaxID=206669 RepID=A0A9Q1BY76_HOLLE|nr:hypothetical protein HOLleu_21692 [Holothuria leucospilota]